MESPTAAPGIDFDNLWMAFGPGDLIYTRNQDIHRVMRLKSMTKCSWPNCWELSVQNFAYDASVYGFTGSYLTMRYYNGYRPLEQLRAFPLRYHPEQDAIRTSLVARGKKYMGLHTKYTTDTTTVSPNRYPLHDSIRSTGRKTSILFK